MVFEVKLILKLTTGTTCSEPKEALDSVLQMLDRQISGTALGTLDKDGLFHLELTRAILEGLNGKYKDKIFELVDGKIEQR